MESIMQNKKILNIALAASTLALLGACAPTPTVTNLPDGSAAYRIDCGGSSVGLNYCFEKAGKTCGAEGYSIVSPDGTVMATVDMSGTNAQELTTGFSTDTTSILIKCGN